MRKIIFVLLWFGLILTIYPQAVFAACPAVNQTETALGCIPNDAIGFTVWVLAKAMGLGGGIAFLIMVGGAIKILTSSGNPDGIKSGSESIFSAIQGLLFIIFSLFLLKLIGLDILQIPGFA